MAVERHPPFLVYGPTGAGLSTALKAFRGFNFLTLGGVEPESVDRFLMMVENEGNVVAMTPLFNPHKIAPLEAMSFLEVWKSKYLTLKLLYLSCPTETLIQRFSAAEKQHPFEAIGLQETIEMEQLLYQALKPLNDYHIDTGSTNDMELTLKIAKILNIDAGTQPLTIHLTSFGYKHGIPTDAELVFDMRFLPNPFYEESLRQKTGLESEVQDYVFSFPQSVEFLNHWQILLAQSLPLYQQQGRTRIKIGIGCTGGQHRSVTMTLAMADFLRKTFPAYDIRVTHREQSHWPQQAPTPQR
jgi:RNase adapter protein RapZ